MARIIASPQNHHDESREAIPNQDDPSSTRTNAIPVPVSVLASAALNSALDSTEEPDSPISWTSADADSEPSQTPRVVTPRESLIAPAPNKHKASSVVIGIESETQTNRRSGSETPPSDIDAEDDEPENGDPRSPDRESLRRITTLEAKTRVLEREADALRLKNKILQACLTQQVSSNHSSESTRVSQEELSDEAAERKRLLEENAALVEQTKKLQRRIKVLSLANSALVEKNNELSATVKEQRHLAGRMLKEMIP